MYVGYIDSPIGILEIKSYCNNIVSIYFVDKKKENNKNDVILKCEKELKEYFEGKRKQFDLPTKWIKGTDFEKNVWNALKQIHYGETVYYNDIAKMIGNKKAVRAVGKAIGKNPISIIIPCHRVIGKNGKLTGYAGGLERKKYLLELEKEKSIDKTIK